MAEFIKFRVTDDLKNLQADLLKKVSKSGKIKIGINEVTKAIERGNAKLVVIAEDVSPPEIVMHLPIISKEKKIPFTYVSTKDELGKLVNISAKASSIAILDAGVLQKELASVVSKINELSGAGSSDSHSEKKTEKPIEKKAEKPAEKKAEKVEEKKE
ncbi:MAG: 50S ribosomal protein L7Ae [archaeon]